jgi:hypothetical protein
MGKDFFSTSNFEQDRTGCSAPWSGNRNSQMLKYQGRPNQSRCKQGNLSVAYQLGRWSSKWQWARQHHQPRDQEKEEDVYGEIEG